MKALIRPGARFVILKGRAMPTDAQDSGQVTPKAVDQESRRVSVRRAYLLELLDSFVHPDVEKGPLGLIVSGQIKVENVSQHGEERRQRAGFRPVGVDVEPGHVVLCEQPSARLVDEVALAGSGITFDQDGPSGIIYDGLDQLRDTGQLWSSADEHSECGRTRPDRSACETGDGERLGVPLDGDGLDILKGQTPTRRTSNLGRDQNFSRAGACHQTRGPIHCVTEDAVRAPGWSTVRPDPSEPLIDANGRGNRHPRWRRRNGSELKRGRKGSIGDVFV